MDLILLFFFLGMLASWSKSDLEVPEAISKFMSIFLLLSLGLKGGHEIRNADDLPNFVTAVTLGLITCLVIPTYMFHAFRKKLGVANSAALSACYGSVSAVTLIAAQGFLTNQAIPYGGYMVAVMALMEIPAILLAIGFYRRESTEKSAFLGHGLWSMKSVVLLLGGFTIGFMMDDVSYNAIAPVTRDCFKGVLAFFLLDLGIVAQRQLHLAWKQKLTAVAAGFVLPLIHGTLTLGLAFAAGLNQGDQIILAVLAGSASYIAAPAAIRSSIPDANPSLYVAMPLALTFPMNVLLGIPFYAQMATWLHRL